MKKYIPISILVLAVIIALCKINFKNKTDYLKELMLLNIECLATPEHPNLHCFGYGTVDCPALEKPVLYYF